MPVLTFSPKQGLYEKRHRQEQTKSRTTQTYPGYQTERIK